MCKRSLLIFLLLTSIVGKSQCLKADILLLADMSGSVHGQETFIHDALNSFVDRFDLSEETIKIGVISFSDNAYMVSELSANRNEVKSKINSMPEADGNTNMLDAFYFAVDQFTNRGRLDARQIIVVISDGVPDNSDNVMLVASQVKSLVTVCGVLVVTGYNKTKFMSDISTSGFYLESDYKGLANQLKNFDICL